MHVIRHFDLTKLDPLSNEREEIAPELIIHTHPAAIALFNSSFTLRFNQLRPSTIRELWLEIEPEEGVDTTELHAFREALREAYALTIGRDIETDKELS